jgi:hypothetical protein
VVVVQEGIEDVACATCRVGVRGFVKHRVLIFAARPISSRQNRHWAPVITIHAHDDLLKTDFHGWRYVFLLEGSRQGKPFKPFNVSKLILRSRLTVRPHPTSPAIPPQTFLQSKLAPWCAPAETYSQCPQRARA